MTYAAVALEELERDALTEIVNIGVSRAASSLRKMVGEQVLLSVPSVEVISHKTAAAVIVEREVDDLVAVRQDFSGAFAGRALLIFPQASSLDLVRAVVGSEMSLSEVVEMEREALAETGNIILNGCLGTMANMLQQSLSMSLPEVMHGTSASVFGAIEEPPSPDGLVLFLYINFSIQGRNIRGYIAVLMDLPSLSALKLLIQNFIAKVMEDEGDPTA